MSETRKHRSFRVRRIIGSVQHILLRHDNLLSGRAPMAELADNAVLKLVICDLDGTLYPADHEIASYVDNRIDSLLKPFVDSFPGGIEALALKYPSVIDAFRVAGLSLKSLEQVYESVPEPLNVDEDPRVARYLSALAHADVRRAVISLAPAPHIRRMLFALGLERSFDIVRSILSESETSKGQAYRDVAAKLGLRGSQVLVAGTTTVSF